MKTAKKHHKSSKETSIVEDKSWLEWSQDNWSAWLDKEVDGRREIYLRDPDELIASYLREKGHEKDYRGRELLELIQNADDAGFDFEGKCRLTVKHTKSALFVGNTGIPFSPKGVKSLMLSDISPKQLLKQECIGYKGLGFRSVLGWASSILIFSGELTIGFGEEYANEWLQKLREEDQRLDEVVRQYEGVGHSNPVPVLSFPRIVTPDGIEEPRLKELYQVGREMQMDGNDTVVCILLKNPKSTRRLVQKQLGSLSCEVLWFLHFLEEVEIDSPELKDCWRIRRKKNVVVLETSASAPECWRIFRKEGTIPKKYLRPGEPFSRYEIKIALPTNEVSPHKLFVYFPTEVLFPFPMLVHGTFEVGANRQHLIRSDANSYIALQLAGLMVKTAEDVKEDSEDPWAALLSITPHGDIDPILNTLDFPREDEGKSFTDVLREKTRRHALLPVRNQKFETPERTKRIKGELDDILVNEAFDEICLHTADWRIRNHLDQLEVGHLQYSDLKERIDSISPHLTMERRSQLISVLLRNYSKDLEKESAPSLLVDEDKKVILSDSPALLPPEGSSHFHLGSLTN